MVRFFGRQKRSRRGIGRDPLASNATRSKIGLMKKIRILCITGMLAITALGGVAEAATPPARPAPYKNPYRPSTPAKTPVTTIRYSGSAQAANMIMPAIWMGLPPLVILALVIRAFSKD